MVKVGIVGGTGYTGVELLRLLARHPQAEIVTITSRKEAGMPVADMFPNLRGHIDLKFCDPQDAGLDKCDVVFFATPNGIAMQQARELLTAGVRVIDLAADFRIQDLEVWKKWYGMEHACPELVMQAVYGSARGQSRADQDCATDCESRLLSDGSSIGFFAIAGSRSGG